MKLPYLIFATVDGEVKQIDTASVRISRANRKALKAAAYYPGVFFAHSLTSERHKPTRLDWRRINPAKTQAANRAKLSENMKAEVNERVEHRKRRQNHKSVDYNEVDPVTGESLNDVMVDMIRTRVQREARAPLDSSREADANLL